jgi:nucleotide-binding universal stress UspA family protein
MSVAVAHQPSPTSTRALREAASEAHRRRTSLAVIHVVDTLDLDKVEALRAGLADELDAALAVSGEQVEWTLYPATVQGDVADTVLTLAKEAGAELLVLEADMPVLVVKD